MCVFVFCVLCFVFVCARAAYWHLFVGQVGHHARRPLHPRAHAHARTREHTTIQGCGGEDGWRGGGEAPDAWVQARVAAVVPGAAAALERALAAAPATAPPFLPLGDVSTATWATATPTALVAWDGDQLRLDGVEATLEAAEALVEGRAVAHVVCLNPRGPRRRAWAAQLAALDGGPWAARAVLIRVAESRCDGVKSGLARLVAERPGVDVVVAATRNKKLIKELEAVVKRVVVYTPPRKKQR